MKILKNKSLWMKILIAVLVIMIVAFVMPNVVCAGDDDEADSWMSSFGGKLISSVLKLLVGIADGCMSILQKAVFGIDDSLLHVDVTSTTWLKILAAVVIAVVAIVAIAATIASGGTVLAIVGSVMTIALKTGLAVTITYAVAIPLVENQLGDDVYFPVFAISPYEIFANDVPTFNVNFFDNSAIDQINDLYSSEDAAEKSNMLMALRKTISDWYVTLRYIALIAMLSILVYIGIRILISSTSADKAKYKQLSMDRLVGMCILFLMHYGMTFANIAVDKITDMVDAIKVEANNSTTKDGIQQYKISDKDLVNQFEKQFGDTYWKQLIVEEGGKKYLYYTADNFLQQARMNGQMQFGIKSDENGEAVLDDDGKPIKYTAYEAIGWRLIYVVLVVYTFIFTFIYIKRFIYMSFLTMISPLVAITYPIDKAGDGKAQGFDLWVKEYVFNLLLQPMHLLLYMILVGSATAFAAKNPIYVMVALGFMIPAEKFLRKMFNFEKANTPGMLGGMAGGALMMNAVKSIMGPKGSGKKGGSGGSGSSGESGGKKPRMHAPDNPDNIYGGAPENTKNLDSGDENEASSLGKETTPGDETDDQLALQEAMEAYRNGDVESGGSYRYSKDLPSEEMSHRDRQKMYDELFGAEKSKPQQFVENAKDKIGDIAQTGTEKANKMRLRLASSLETGKNKIAGSKVGRGAKKVWNSKAGLATRAGASRYWSNQKLRAMQRVKNSHPIRTFGGLATGAALGGLGVVAGIVDGSPSKALSYGALGAKGGYSLGNGFIGNAYENSGLSGTYTAMKDEIADPDKARQKEHDKFIKEWKNSDDMKKLEKSVGRERANEVASQYLDVGVKDVDSIIACEKMIKDSEFSGIKDVKSAAAVAKFHDGTVKGNTTKMDMTGLEKTIKGNLADAGWSGKDLDSKYKELCKMNNKFDGLKKDSEDNK